MYWVFAFISIALITGSLITLYFAYLGWVLRRSTGAIAFIMLMLCISFWSFSYALEQFTPLLEEKIFWHQMAYIGIPFVPVAWIIFNAQVLGLSFASRPYWVGVICIVPAFTTISTWTYKWHSWMWKGFSVESHFGIAVLAIERMPEYYVYAGYSYLLLAIGIGFFIRILRRSPSIGAPSMTLMTFAVSTAVIFNVLHVTIDFEMLGPYDLSPITLATIGVIAGWFIFRFGPLDVLSVARVALLENINDGFIVMGLSNTVVSMNNAAQRMLDVSEREAKGKELQTLIPEGATYFGAKSRQPIFTELVGLGIRSSDSPDTRQVRHELLLPRPESENGDLHIDLSISNLFDRRNRPRGSLIILRDVSQQKQAQQALIQAQRVESAGILAGGVAHDFNNLLAAITMRHQLAISALGGDAELAPLLGDMTQAPQAKTIEREDVQTILRHLFISRKAVERASDLTRQLLAYTGKGDFKIEPIELNALIRENENLLATAVSAEIYLNITFSPEPLYIFADQGQLQQVIMNLLLNAVDAIEDGCGQIDVQTSCIDVNIEEAQKYIWKDEPIEGTYACFSVSDSGSGMSPEVQARIFDPFFTTKKDGRGLGLSALLGAVHLYDGGIQVVSTKERGTTFRVLLPTETVAEPAQLTKTQEFGPIEKFDGLHTVLIADDEKSILNVLDEVLTDLGLKIVTAADGQQALDKFVEQQDEIDLVVLDAKMPVMNGIETLTAIREVDPNAHALLSSGYSEQHLSGIVDWDVRTDFIQKPYEIDLLIEKIDGLLGGVGLRKLI